MAEVPKPPGVFRILCYGDSLTDGLPETAWPLELQALLGPGFEVLDAGVAGYSSHQGLLRLQEDAKEFRPDLVIACFGWNDAMSAHGRPDRDFPLPSPGRLAFERALLPYRAYRCLRLHARGRGPLAALASDPTRPRVDPDDFLANLARFADLAREHGGEALLLTRPFRKDRLERLDPPWMRRFETLYTGRVMDMARVHGIPALDVGASLDGRPELFLDLCHLTPEGHREMARLVLEEVRRLR